MKQRASGKNGSSGAFRINSAKKTGKLELAALIVGLSRRVELCQPESATSGISRRQRPA